MRLVGRPTPRLQHRRWSETSVATRRAARPVRRGSLGPRGVRRSRPPVPSRFAHRGRTNEEHRATESWLAYRPRVPDCNGASRLYLANQIPPGSPRKHEDTKKTKGFRDSVFSWQATTGTIPGSCELLTERGDRGGRPRQTSCRTSENEPFCRQHDGMASALRSGTDRSSAACL